MADFYRTLTDLPDAPPIPVAGIEILYLAGRVHIRTFRDLPVARGEGRDEAEALTGVNRALAAHGLSIARGEAPTPRPSKKKRTKASEDVEDAED